MIQTESRVRNYSIRNILLSMLFVFPFLQPDVVNFYPSIHKYFVLFSILNLIVLLIVYVHQKKLSIYFIALLIWRSYIFFDTIIQLRKIDFSSLYRTVFILGISLIIELGFRKAPLDTLCGIYIITMFISLLNLVSCLKGGVLFNNGVPYFVYGLRTRFTDSAIPLIVISMLISWIRKGRLFSMLSILTISVVGFQLFYEWVATGIFVLALIILLCVIGSLNRIKFYPKITFLIGISTLIAVTFFRIQNYFKFIIVDVLHKSLDLHGRTAIWDSAMSFIKQKAIFGYGEEQMGRFIKVWWSPTPVPAHNMLLQVLHDGGIVSAILLFAILLYAVNRVSKVNLEMNVSNLLVVTMLAMCFSILTEISFYYVYFYILPALCANSGKIYKGETCLGR